MPILNLTQHVGTPEQLADGLVEPTPEQKKEIQYLLTFEKPPTQIEMMDRADKLATMAAENFEGAMIGGAPYFMAPLEKALCNVGVVPFYSFSKREAVDVPQPDGSVKKTQVFRHVCWV